MNGTKLVSFFNPAGHAFFVWPAFTFNQWKIMNTEITLPAPDLKNALSGLNKLIGRKTTLPVLSHIKVTRELNGMVTLQGTDLDAHATFTIAGNQPGPTVELLVPLEQLNNAFKCTGTKQDVALVCEGKTTKLRYFLGGNPVHQPLNTLPVKEWPPMPEITVESKPLQPGFGEALKEAMQCCSEDPSRYTLRGAYLDARDARAHYIVGTNGRFLYSANTSTFPIKEDVIVPDSKFIRGSGLLDEEPCSLSVQPGKKPSDAKHICLQNKQWQFVMGEIAGKYPNWKQVLPAVNSSWTLVKLGAPAIEQLLKVIPNLPGQDGDHNAVRLRTGNNWLWIEGRNKDDADWTKIAVQDVEITGKAREISLNRDYLLPALKFGLNELAIQDELSPMVLSKDGKKMVIMPVKMDGTTPQTTKPTPVASTPMPATTLETSNERIKMPRNAKPEITKPSEPSTSLISQVEKIKDSLKNVVRDLNSLVDAVKVQEKDQRATEKEVEAARATLKKLQQVTI
jgi:DNA polymerase III sliding clamp (beta) subunit (PCNA family)